jgi:hypothetical protein
MNMQYDYTQIVSGLGSSSLSNSRGWADGLGSSLGSAASSLVSAAFGRALGTTGSIAGMSQGGREQMALMKIQEQLQRENQVFSLMSNISKTNHETRMAAVRNMRP